MQDDEEKKSTDNVKLCPSFSSHLIRVFVFNNATWSIFCGKPITQFVVGLGLRLATGDYDDGIVH